MNHEGRIRELSDQLDDITKDEQPELDDAIEITDPARKKTHRLLLYFDANRTVPYLSAYGKEFPDPFLLMLSSIGSAPHSTRPSDEDWPGIRDFVIKEVSWQVGGLNLEKQEQVGAQVSEFLDKTRKLSEPELKKGGLPGGKMKREIGKIVNVVDCTDIIRNVLQQDLAELLSNPAHARRLESPQGVSRRHRPLEPCARRMDASLVAEIARSATPVHARFPRSGSGRGSGAGIGI